MRSRNGGYTEVDEFEYTALDTQQKQLLGDDELDEPPAKRPALEGYRSTTHRTSTRFPDLSPTASHILSPESSQNDVPSSAVTVDESLFNNDSARVVKTHPVRSSPPPPVPNQLRQFPPADLPREHWHEVIPESLPQEMRLRQLFIWQLQRGNDKIKFQDYLKQSRAEQKAGDIMKKIRKRMIQRLMDRHIDLSKPHHLGGLEQVFGKDPNPRNEKNRAIVEECTAATARYKQELDEWKDEQAKLYTMHAATMDKYSKEASLTRLTPELLDGLEPSARKTLQGLLSDEKSGTLKVALQDMEGGVAKLKESLHILNEFQEMARGLSGEICQRATQRERASLVCRPLDATQYAELPREESLRRLQEDTSRDVLRLLSRLK